MFLLLKFKKVSIHSIIPSSLLDKYNITSWKRDIYLYTQICWYCFMVRLDTGVTYVTNMFFLSLTSYRLGVFERYWTPDLQYAQLTARLISRLAKRLRKIKLYRIHTYILPGTLSSTTSGGWKLSESCFFVL